MPKGKGMRSGAPPSLELNHTHLPKGDSKNGSFYVIIDAPGAGRNNKWEGKMNIDTKDCLHEELLETMNFLNEVVNHYPKAVSFAPGRPVEKLFKVEDSFSAVAPFVAAMAKQKGIEPEAFYNSLGQYGRTNGVIGDLLARYLAVDEQIEVKGENIMVTSGCQEGMAILLMGLFQPGKDVLMVSDPSYIGITGLARVLDVEVWPIAVGDQGLEPEAVAEAVAQIRKQGKRPRAIYDVPDFNNPLGTSMPLQNRKRLLEVAREQDILIFEDNPYGQFGFDSEPLPTIKSMDTEGRVIYMGTFSKTLYPGLRLGFLVSELQTTAGTRLTDDLSKVKSFVSVNTSGLLQAIVGGVLIQENYSLRAMLEPKIAFYKQSRDHMTACLKRFLAEEGVADQVTWNTPGGGFFLTVNVPFEFDEDSVRRCAAEFDVICCPMNMFALLGGRQKQIRLSFSYVTQEQIEKGIRGFAKFCAAEIK